MPPIRTLLSSDKLLVGAGLIAPQKLVSSDGGFSLAMQQDGNLVIYNRLGTATWSTDTWSLPAGQKPVKAVLKSSGSLVLIDAAGVERWSSRSDSPGVDRMVLQNSGILAIFAGQTIAWSSARTLPKPPPRPFPIDPVIIPRPPVSQTRDQQISSFGRLSSVADSNVKIGDLAPVDVNANGVNYRVTQERYQTVRDVVKQSYLKDLASMGVWPGQVIQGSALNGGGVAAIGPFTRVPGTINISTEFVASMPGQQYAEVSQPSAATIDQARRAIVNSLNATDAVGTLNATFEQASTLREIGVNAGLNVTGSAFSVDANMSLNQTFKQSCVVGVIRQVFYNVSFDPSVAGSNGFWPESISMSQLSPYMGSGNPPLYISSVQYGRMICILARGEFSSSELKASIKASHDSSVKVGANADTKWKDVLNRSDVTIYTIGVPGYANFQKLSSPVEELDKVYQAGLKFSTQNPGAPISFVAKHIADNTDAHVSLVAQYTKAVSAIGADFGPATYSVWDGPGGGTVDTGVNVNPGDTVTVSTKGQIWSGAFLSGTHGPEGWPGHKPDPAAPVPTGANAYSFILSIGGQKWFEAKTFWSGTPPSGASGRLLLGINDNIPYNGDPNKKWTSTVTVKRGNATSAGVYI